MEGIRFAWKIFSFSDVPSSSVSSSSSSAGVAPSSNGNSGGGRYRHRRISLHRACSLALPSNNNVPPSGRASLSNNKETQPGAYAITRSKGFLQSHRVEIPRGATPGSEFTATVGTRQIQVQCPWSSRPGNFVRISVPGESVTRQRMLTMATLTEAAKEEQQEIGVKEETKTTTANLQQPKEERIKIKVPAHIRPGMEFTTTYRRKVYRVICPEEHELPRNRKICIVPLKQQQKENVNSNAPATGKSQLFEVTVPKGVQPNDTFDMLAHGQRVSVQCPSDAVPGQTFRCRVPVEDILIQIQLRYKNVAAGWYRSVRAQDFKLHWVYSNGDGEQQDNIDMENEKSLLTKKEADQFDTKRSAFCRKLTIQKGKDPRMPTGTVALVPAQEALVGSKLSAEFGKGRDKKVETIFSYGDVTLMQGKPLEEKSQWFRGLCNRLTYSWDEGNIKVVVRREALLEDSVKAVMSLGKEDLRKPWRFEFVDEPGVDSGGVSREWFQLASERVFDPDNGLWQCSANNQMCVTINPGSAAACQREHDHLVYFRFAGRLLGRALFDHQIIRGHLVQFLYKHLLGLPIDLEDIAADDTEYYHSLLELKNMEDVASMYLDFTVTEIIAGEPTAIELVPDGANIEVDNRNLGEYFSALLQYRMMERTKPQLTELLLGFLDIVPEPALAAFDSSELELLLCGLLTIDVDDWEENTRYSGCFKANGKDDQTVKWFWDIVHNNFDYEMKARLLQFVTGTSGVPSRGFAALQGVDGSIKTFAIYGIEDGHGVYPRAHTCFNRIDIGVYGSKDELEKKLRASVNLSAVGFGLD